MTDVNFKYLTQELDCKNLELLKQKGGYPHEYTDNFKRFGEEKLPDKKYFYRTVKDEKTGDNDEI